MRIVLKENNLLLEIGGKGKTKLVPKNANGIISNGKDLRTFNPKVGEILNKSGELGYYQFRAKGFFYIVEFPYVCT